MICKMPLCCVANLWCLDVCDWRRVALWTHARRRRRSLYPHQVAPLSWGCCVGCERCTFKVRA